ncbi:hypothetical protein C4D60_Mb09t26640 [Musa balbisiana]|uniref:Cysteine-rich PDZ-binding protein n=1 Tax=Musa balbisiana TaxID=52838 RepID=A0A4S8IJD2_MUSBA|nr:hypothetical protein C4D60_Mb09t26640 [Musa balbisiana]
MNDLSFSVSFAGEKKLGKVIVPDKWKEGASNTTESGGRKINENKLLSKKNRSFLDSSRIGTGETPSPFDARLHPFSASGVCAMCGKQVLDTKLYKQSNRAIVKIASDKGHVEPVNGC